MSRSRHRSWNIELAQLGLLALVVPWLLLLARTRAFAPFRICSASVCAMLAAGWLIERTTSWPNPAAALLATLEKHPLALLCALASSAALAQARPLRVAPSAVTAQRQAPSILIARVSRHGYCYHR